MTSSRTSTADPSSVPASANNPWSAAGLWCIAGAAIATVGATATAAIHSSVPPADLSYPYTPTAFRLTEVLWTITHVLMFIGTVGLTRSGLLGTSRLGRVGKWIAVAGMALIVPSELGFAFFATAADDSTPSAVLGTAIGLSVVIAGLGFVLSGIAALRADHWSGWGRYTPLLCGLFIFVVLLPAQIIRPSAYLWPVAGWSACFLLLGLALYRQRPPRGTATPPGDIR
jgi:hypothetical protein